MDTTKICGDAILYLVSDNIQKTSLLGNDVKYHDTKMCLVHFQNVPFHLYKRGLQLVHTENNQVIYLVTLL